MRQRGSDHPGGRGTMSECPERDTITIGYIWIQMVQCSVDIVDTVKCRDSVVDVVDVVWRRYIK